MVPVDRLAAVLAVVVFLALYGIGTRRTGSTAANVASLAVIVGIVAARAAYVAAHFSSFRADISAIFAIWQGGFAPWAGIIAAAVTLMLLLRRTPSLVPALTSLAIAAALWAGTAHFITNGTPTPLPTGLVAHDLAGKAVRLDSLRGKPFVINLWATWCGPCQREMPMLVQAAKERPDVPVLFLDQGEDTRTIQAFLADKMLKPANVLLDPKMDSGRALGAAALPTTIFVASDGTIRTRHLGEISRAALDAGMDDLREFTR